MQTACFFATHIQMHPEASCMPSYAFCMPHTHPLLLYVFKTCFSLFGCPNLVQTPHMRMTSSKHSKFVFK